MERHAAGCQEDQGGAAVLVCLARPMAIWRAFLHTQFSESESARQHMADADSTAGEMLANGRPRTQSPASKRAREADLKWNVTLLTAKRIKVAPQR
jgi:hypothetical protein